MTRAVLARAVEHWRAQLLPEWRVVLLDRPPPWNLDTDEYDATSRTSESYHRLTVFFTDECLAKDDAEIHVTIVHELLHALTRPWRVLLDRVVLHVPSAVLNELNAQQTHEEEQLIERLARTLVAPLAQGVGPGTISVPWRADGRSIED